MKSEIQPFIGFDEIHFGKTKEQIESIIGQPSKELKEIYSDDSLAIILKYEELGIECTFSSDDDFLLGTISFFSNEFTFLGVSLVGVSEEEFVEKAKDIQIFDLTLDDDFIELKSKDYISDSFGMSFWIHEGKLDSITIFPEYENDNNTPIWPDLDKL